MSTSKSSVGIFEAKTNLGQLVARVEKGEVIIITRHGDPVARLVPFQEDVDRRRAREAISDLRTLAKGLRLPEGVSIRDLIDEGRRF